jgi:hypothetical protein
VAGFHQGIFEHGLPRIARHQIPRTFQHCPAAPGLGSSRAVDKVSGDGACDFLAIDT